MEVPFTVSARSARLIGRENIANQEGAIIELVKNSYDADANLCILFFDGNDTLYIIDDGDGMTDEVIRNHWMVIGTSNKEANIISQKERVRTGAKGIGRFALDRLGSKCIMTTKPKGKKHGYIWNVDWQAFESNSALTIGDIKASLSTKENLNQKEVVLSTLPKTQGIEQTGFKNGTILQIDQLRDNWDKKDFDKLFNNLRSLIPPLEANDFSIYLLCSEYPDDYGEISSLVCDDYDYKLVAKVFSNQNVEIKIWRNETDIESLPPKFFQQNGMREYPFDKNTFEKGYFQQNKTLKELLPGFEDQHQTLKTIGKFSFTFYFMKRTTNTNDSTKYFYKDFNARLRRKWLNQHGGIRIYRDKFRVRPYGEPESPATDWLGLATRQALSPAAVSRKRDWRVRDFNIAGIVEISRRDNPDLEDQANREGIQENKTFSLFKEVLVGIIATFEDDRSYIASEMSKLTPKEETKEKVKEIKEALKNKPHDDDTEEIQTLLSRIDDIERELEDSLNDQQILRVLASNGAMVASFVHELHNIEKELKHRFKEFRKDILPPFINKEEIEKTPDYKNPFKRIDEMEKTDQTLLGWMQFALGAIKNDKRKRKKIKIKDYFRSLEKMWKFHLDDRQVNMVVCHPENDIELKAFEVDLMTVFNNLIINSIDAFMRNDAPEKREIHIAYNDENDSIKFSYKDSGPGLLKEIDKPERIFDMLFTTKRDKSTGYEIGSGIGMWLVQSTIKDYNGNLKLKRPRNGFELEIILPKTKKRGQANA
ncbi:MAG: ATP-binding protein [Candidatus Dadabacteria bacterium]|nr:ATP-binding protein [Candidatus Dadabacteria bacterium]